MHDEVRAARHPEPEVTEEAHADGAHVAQSSRRPPPDPELVAIADYVVDRTIDSEEAYATARLVLMDSLACACLALDYPACTRHLGPLVPDTVVPHGARVPGTGERLDPVKAAFDLGVLVRWLDYNDTWLAAEWGHPSDNLGGILMLADHLSRKATAEGRAPFTMHDVLTWMIKAHEIQGVLALENAFNRVGLDHVVLVKVATAAIAARMLGLDRDGIVAALSHAWVDGQSLRTYRHAPNAGPRKSWAAGDATSRGVWLALRVAGGEEGIPTALSAPGWGFYDVLFGGERLRIPRAYGSYVMENVLFKIAYPAEFHAQTAVEAALRLHPEVVGRLDAIARIELQTQEPALRIISKEGPLANPADRDHCLQYMVAVALIHGKLTAACYEDAFAADPRIDALRARMRVAEAPEFTAGYYDPERRSIGNAVQVVFADGSRTERVVVEYPVGHRRRRDEGRPLLARKFRDALSGTYPASQTEAIAALCGDPERLAATPVDAFCDLLAT
ncbi:MAG: bifunctional 2-methylcitrate dehydratase/aconitate hydratase [Gammaproteobacteria bacterium]|nr:bifunctional 2-methylcitrate dehydratase/aconitate hydratase [Gammaproteobacteria bacterium]